MTHVTRREFIRLATLMGGVSLFAGCNLFGEANQVPEYIRGAPGVDPLETLLGINNVNTVCGLCPGNCGIRCRVAQGFVVKIGGNPYHPAAAQPWLPFTTPLDVGVSVGASVCAIGGSGLQNLYDPFRVVRPLKRVGPRGSGKWRSLSWAEAISEIVQGGDLFGEGKIAGLRALMDSGSGLSFLVGRADWGSVTFIRHFLSRFSGASLVRDQTVALDKIASDASDAVFGTGTGPVAVDYSKVRFLLSFGDAPLDTGVPLISVAREISDARLKVPGLQWVVLDPRLSTSASKSDRWIPVKPDADIYVALGIASAIAENHPEVVKVPRDDLDQMISGLKAADFAQLSGVAPEIPIALAKVLAMEKNLSAVIPGGGIFTQPGGFETAKVILGLNALVGSVPGNSCLTCRNDRFLTDTRRKLFPDMDSAQVYLDSEPESAAWIIWDTDPVYNYPTTFCEQLRDISKNPLVVCIDREITETAFLADYILPDTTYLERWDICQSPPALRVPGFGVRVPVVGGFDANKGDYFPILPETRLMEDILILLGATLELPNFRPDHSGILPKPYQFYHRLIETIINSMKQSELVSGSGIESKHVMERGGLFTSADHAWQPKKAAGNARLSTPHPIPRPTEMGNGMDEFFLVSFSQPFHRSPRSVANSWLMEVAPENRLLIATKDAHRLRISQGDKVVLETLDGKHRAECRAHVVPGIRPGVVALARGYGYSQLGSALNTIDNQSLGLDTTRAAGTNSSRLTVGNRSRKIRVTKA